VLDNVQAEQAQAKLDQAKAKVVEWLTYLPPAKDEDRQKDPKYDPFTTEQTHTYSSGEVKRRMSMAQRIDEYRAKLAHLHDASRRMWVMGKDVEGARLTAAKSEVAGLRAGLLRDLDEQTQEMKKSLDSILTPKQKALGSVPAPEGNRLVSWVDLLTRWGLVAVGGCLMIGFLTRLSAWLGAGFLLMTILAVPSVPWLPAPPISEGSYLFVNKNVIELLALCVLATTYTGRWCGVDGILYHGWRWITGKPVASSQ
jgi:thiosulfate dehydrogenase [quinone] large subunit